MAEEDFTTEHFHGLIHKQIVNAVYERLADGKMDWSLVRPFAEAGRRLAAAEFRDHADVRLHAIRSEGGQWVDAEEAYVGISVSDEETGETWLSETRWVSELALASDDPAHGRRVIAALERSIERIRAALEEADEATPGPDESPSRL